MPLALSVEQEEVMKYKYEDKSLLGGWRIKVKKGPATVGNIRKNPSSGGYQFFKGPANELSPSFEEQSIDALKLRIEALSL